MRHLYRKIFDLFSHSCYCLQSKGLQFKIYLCWNGAESVKSFFVIFLDFVLDIVRGFAKLVKMESNEYKCDRCGEVFSKTWSDEDAEVEAVEIFGEEALKDRAVVCDDCYNVVMRVNQN